MADALVSIALEKLADVMGQQLSLFAGATRELKKLSSTFESIKALLDDAEARQVGQKHVQLWLSRLRHAAYDVEDLLADASNHSVSRYNIPRCIKDPYNVGHRIKEIRKRLDQIDADRKRFGFSDSPVGGDQRMLVRIQRLTTPLMDESEMVIGREDDKETLVSRLVSGSSSNEDRGQVQVVAIVGIVGVGKTTLARRLYHDAKVRGHFNRDLYWVCVSEPFNVLRLTKDIIEEVKRGPPTRPELDALQDELLQSLRGKRYLLVLDDVWNDDDEKWKMLRLSLISGAHGSRILVTTRSEKVANTMNANYIHELKALSDDQSWTLFRSRAFAEGREVDSEFVSIGKGIVKKCQGVPLVIKVAGSAMNTKRTVEDWKNELESKIWYLQQAADEILPALLLTYYNLPTRLKQCFAYCSMFPKDWVFEKDLLVNLWVAQGFIHSDGKREKEDIGGKYFDELVARSMFQEIKEDYEGKISCKMHDLLHDLAEFIAKDENYTLISNSEGGKSEEWCGSSGDVRHAYLYFSGKIPITGVRAVKLRTLWLDGIDKSDSGIIDSVLEARFLRALSFPNSTRLPKSIGRLKHLRYLHLPYSGMVEVPDTIGKLEQLRYLDLSVNSNIEELPESVSDLRNLHTLNITGCVKLKRLPSGMGGMVSLRHLQIERTDSLQCLPEGLGKISCLQSLCKFIVGGEGGCRIDELLPLNFLQGILRIQHLERVSGRDDAEKAQLGNKPGLRRLVLSMFGKDDDGEIERMESVLEGLRPHANLEELKLFCYTGSKLPSWMQAESRVRKLELYGCPNLEGKSPRVSSLVHLEKISVIDSSEFFSSGLPHLPNLKTFEIRRFRNETFPDEGWKLFSALQTLEIWNCDELKSLPDGLAQLQSLEKLTIFGCDRLEWLPESLGQLRKLKSLTIGVLEALSCLPDSLGLLESLEHLEISSCDKLERLPDSLGQLRKLKSLTIGVLEALKCLPDSLGQLESLEHLEISSCDKLEWLPDSLGQLRELKSLTIGVLEALSCMPDSLGLLESLEHLEISSCDKLKWLPDSLGRLEKLKLLRIQDLQALSCLPDSLGLLESLEHLNIRGLEKLVSVPDSLGQLTALNHLEIRYCKALGSLPHGLQRLLFLRELYISDCPVLSQRCQTEEGEDWPKISHIPCITINDQRIQ